MGTDDARSGIASNFGRNRRALGNAAAYETIFSANASKPFALPNGRLKAIVVAHHGTATAAHGVAADVLFLARSAALATAKKFVNAKLDRRAPTALTVRYAHQGDLRACAAHGKVQLADTFVTIGTDPNMRRHSSLHRPWWQERRRLSHPKPEPRTHGSIRAAGCLRVVPLGGAGDRPTEMRGLGRPIKSRTKFYESL